MYLIHLTCSNCNFEKTIELEFDKNGIYSITNLFCPKCLHKLDRELQEMTDVIEGAVEPIKDLDKPEDIDEVEDVDEPSAD